MTPDPSENLKPNAGFQQSNYKSNNQIPNTY